MGSELKGRSCSAHRSGFAARAVSVALYQAGGGRLDDSVLNAVVRACGWEAVKGKKTALQIYVHTALDTCLKYRNVGFGEG